MKDYLYNLFVQFQDAEGFKSNDVNSKVFQQDFIEWIKTQIKISNIYRDYLFMNGVDYLSANSIEVGKGGYDSIAIFNPSSKLITEYADSFDENCDKNRIVNSKININSIGEPYAFVVDASKHSHKTFKIQSQLFYTHNTYNSKDLYTFIKLHNFANNIVVGAFGRLSDKDRTKKISELREMKEQLQNGTYFERYIISGDTYSYFIQSDQSTVDNRRRLIKEHKFYK